MNLFSKKNIYFFWIGFLGLMFFCPFEVVRAVTVSPLRQVVTVDAGSGTDVFIEVQNETDKSANFDLRVTGVDQGENGRPIIADGLDYAETWVIPNETSLKINAGGKVNAYFHVQVPKGAESRLHYLGLVVTPKKQNQSGNAISPEIVSYLLVQVAGKVREQVQVVAWNLPRKVFFWPKEIPVNLTVRNAGSTLVPVEVYAEISDWKEAEVLVGKNKSVNNILPGAIRTEDLIFDLETVSGLGFGVYEVSSSIRFGYFGVKNLEHLRFFVISKTIFGLGLTVLIILGLGLYFLKKKFQR